MTEFETNIKQAIIKHLRIVGFTNTAKAFEILENERTRHKGA